MKANKFFLGLALIGAILTGCEPGPEVPENNDVRANAYVSVKITMASIAGTRASDGGFAEGTDIEQTISGDKSIFLFYDSIGNWVTSGQLATQVPGQNDSIMNVDSTKKIINSTSADAYIVLSGPDVELQKSRQVLTVVNYSNCEALKQLNLAQALEIVTTETNDSVNNGFLMTTSVYFDPVKNGIVNTTAITGDNIQATTTLANQHPVEIYIERASAKATLTLNSGVQDAELDSGIVVDGIIKDVVVHVNNWHLNNVYKSTYLVKHLDNTWNESTNQPFSGWNWSGAKRSYWAKSHHWIDGTGLTQIRSYAEANLAIDASTYCYENTVETPLCSAGVDNPNVNTVLIAAQFKVKDDTLQNLYKYSGVFYTENTYKNLILKQIKEKGYKKDDDSAYTTADLTISPKGSSIAEIRFDITNPSTTQIEGKDVVTFVNELAYVTQTVGYANGKCYYQIPVEHLATSGSAQYGMVRNHWYQIKVNSINRIGEPVFDENEDIPGIPEETTEHYLSAEIHVLSWHVVNQNVDL